MSNCDLPLHKVYSQILPCDICTGTRSSMSRHVVAFVAMESRQYFTGLLHLLGTEVYHAAMVCRNGWAVRFTILHRLVAFAWVPGLQYSAALVESVGVGGLQFCTGSLHLLGYEVYNVALACRICWGKRFTIPHWLVAFVRVGGLPYRTVLSHSVG